MFNEEQKGCPHKQGHIPCMNCLLEDKENIHPTIYHQMWKRAAIKKIKIVKSKDEFK